MVVKLASLALVFAYSFGLPVLATTELSGTLTREENGAAINNHTVGVTRWSVAEGTPSGAAIPVEWTATSDAAGFYRFDLDDSLPGMDRLLVFTSDHRVYGELYPAVDLRGVDPKGADIVEPGVVTLDLTAGPLTGINFEVARSRTRYWVLMRDGVTNLDTHVELPSRRPGMQWPVLLHRTPYALGLGPASLLREDYVVVKQNSRGRFNSEGEDMVFDADGWLEHPDGYDTVKWVAQQPWCLEERICTFGASAPGITQYLLSGTTPEELVCMWVEVATGNPYHDIYFPGGEFRKHMMETWLENNGSSHKLDEVFQHPNEDAYWQERNLLNRLSVVDVPMLHYGGWYDIFSQGTLDAFSGLQDGDTPGARRNQKLVIGPWTHRRYYLTQQGEAVYPQDSLFLEWEEYGIDWFDFWLKGIDNGIMDSPPVRAYVMGPGIPSGGSAGNFWRTSVSWPPPATETAYYLHPGGLLSTDAPTVAGAETSYVADPDDPVPTLGGNNLYDDIGTGPYDQQTVDGRADVLTWQTGPLLQPVEVSGPIKLVLHAASDRPDTDWAVKLEDVYPDGRVMLVMDLILKARHRAGFDREDLLTPGQVYEFEIDLWDTSITFAFGHSIRVAVASSNFPRFESNPQTGEPFNEHTSTAIATNRIVHDASHPSRLLLPVVDPTALQGCPATEPVTGLTVDKTTGGIRLDWDPVVDACHQQYRVYAGIEGPQWPWIVRRPIGETGATRLDSADDGLFWQVVSEGTDGGNGPHGVAP